MRINPVLKNETKLAVRSFKFTLVIFFYVVLLSAGALFIFNVNVSNAYFNGINLQYIISFYFGLAIIQAMLLMFIVPSLTATAICSEREKQTLEVLLSTKMTTFSIVSGKLMASISRVVILIICTMPIYSIAFLIGGISLENILQLSLFFIVTTIFVGSIGVFISTFIKTSRAATAITYGVTLFIYVGIVIISYIIVMINMSKAIYPQDVTAPLFSYLSPTTGFISLLSSQLGSESELYYVRFINVPGFEHGYLISMGVQLVISALLVFIAAYKLNPVNRGMKYILRRK
ncbi:MULTISPECIES: ABC transporter permease subunit [unclassified Clostridium]|uniref:ABC transporter permease n=1 Tax=unclassified Clostridium TaxID=2614128 RepID=UPI000297E1ED|nr:MULTISPECIES: ABC transporter permease subunit [unclassified Clostridium]EKQ51411.1 MAG: hypothetical protein A370_04851 [Clostridium sp. Maddingley MBC34-26]